MLSGADASAEELDQEGVEGSDTRTADEWLSLCDSGFPSVVRVEDLGCIGIVVRSTLGGVEVAVPSGATPGMPDSVGVELSSEPGFYSGSEAIHAQGSSTRLSQLETPEKGAFASASAQLGLSQKSRGPGSTSSIAGGLTVPSVLGRSAPSLSGPAACARARALLGGGADPRAIKLRMHDQVPATPVGLQTAQPDPPNEVATLGSALLRIASALEQEHDSGGTGHDAFGLNPGVANSQEEYDAIFGDQSSRESFGAARLGGQALIARVVRTRKEKPEVVVAAHESRVRRDLSVLVCEAWSWRRHADVCQLPGKSGNLQRQNALITTLTLFWNRCPRIHLTKWSVDGPSWASRTQRGRVLLPGPPQSRVPWWPYHKERVALDAARKSMGASE